MPFAALLVAVVFVTLPHPLPRPPHDIEAVLAAGPVPLRLDTAEDSPDAGLDFATPPAGCIRTGEKPPRPQPGAVALFAALVCDVFPRQEWGRALCVMGWESYGNPDLVYVEANGDRSVGLFSINADNLAGRNRIRGLRAWPARYHDGDRYTLQQAEGLLKRPWWNVVAARDIWRANGWAVPWAAQAERCGLAGR